jgi:predicted unusual protein kinase regulating ubiquinone biosynthesis (AarF/ABC1/UbiB family)
MKIKTRFFKVAYLFLKISLDFRKESLLARKNGFEYAQARMEKTCRKRAAELYTLAITMGGVMIKLCQYLSTRQDILPAPYIDKLKSLQDEVPPAPFSEMEKIIHEDYQDYQSIFASIDPEPLASASLGQVHRGILKNGDEVILKILKPGITGVIDLDFAILYSVFKLFSHIRFFSERMDFENVLDEFIRVTGDELNFRREVCIAIQFRRAFENLPYLVIPRIYKEYCTDRIIVMEYIRGDKITEKGKWLSRNNDPVILSRRLIEIYLEQFLFIKLIHFDPHPGNILVLDNNRLALLDFGMAGEINQTMSSGIKRIIMAVLNREYETILTVLDELGFFRKGTDIYTLLPVIEFFFDKVLSSIKLERESLMAVDLSPIVNDLVEIIYTHPFKLPVEWAYIGRTVGTLVGIISSLYPDINIYDELKPSFDKIMQENMTDKISAILDQSKNFLKEIYFLPGKVNQFIQRTERGNMKFKFEQGEINRTITCLNNTVVRGICLITAVLSSFFSFVFHILNHGVAGITFGSLAGVFLLVSILYRTEMEKDIIKKRISR